MITSEQIYWITRLDNILGFFIIAFVISLICSVILFAMYVMEDTDPCGKDASILRRIKWTLFCMLGVLGVSAGALVFLPSTAEVAAMYIIPKVTNSEFVQDSLSKEASELYQLTKEYLKKKVAE